MGQINEIIKNLGIMLNNIDALIVILVSVVATAVAAYIKIKQLIESSKARAELRETTVPLIMQAKEQPLSLLNELVNKPIIFDIQETVGQLSVQSNIGKNNIVAQALIEREPKLLKKLKLNDILQVGQFVSSVYGLIKPVIKAKQ